jgi:glyoxylase-like metal-dependent hydrolase (beta-lactamase superfamily II)
MRRLKRVKVDIQGQELLLTPKQLFMRLRHLGLWDMKDFLENNPTDLFNDFKTLFVNGHTEAQMIPHITYKDKTIVFAADLLPSTGHIPLPYVMGYDTRPLLTLTEKEKFLKHAAEQEYILFLQHDNYSECCTVEQTDRGVRLKETFTLSEIL